jgi:hypothetical protein
METWGLSRPEKKTQFEIVAVVEEIGVHEWARDWKQVLFQESFLFDFQQTNAIVLCTTSHNDIEVIEIMDHFVSRRNMEAAQIPVIFGTYKGLRYHPSNRPDLAVFESINGFVCHSASVAREMKDPRVFFAPLSASNRCPPPSTNRGFSIFVGGRQDRDFETIYQAVCEAGLQATFLSDLLPSSVVETSHIRVIREKVSLRDYLREQSLHSLVAVSLRRPARLQKGQLDSARAVACGLPLIVTADSSCDDYVLPEISGYRVSQTVDDWTEALLRAENFMIH